MEAEAIKKKGNWRVQVTLNTGETLFMGSSKDDIFCKYREFNSKEEAEKYIENHEKLELKEEN